MKIFRFQQFNESYLSGSRQPMYHMIGSYYSLRSIIESDTFKMKSPVRPKNGPLSNSWTRNLDFGDGILHKASIILEVDVDKLLKDGIKFYPVDEWALGQSYSSTKTSQLGKSNFSAIKSGKRGTKHGLKLPKEPMLETEFEERTYQDIKNLGKYIISIRISEDISVKRDHEMIKSYLEKYPHIKIVTFNINNRRKLKDITSEYQNVPQTA